MIAAGDIVATLRGLGVSGGPLMVHADLRACLRVSGGNPLEKLETVESALVRLAGDGPLVMPTFTYSFCRGENYDPTWSRSVVGVLSEHFRHRPDVRRTMDPLFSAAVLGEVPERWERLFDVDDVDCFGPESMFAMLHELDATLMFLGVGIEACTFVHYAEQLHRVPYRQIKQFYGRVIEGGRRMPAVARYFVRPLDGTVEADFGRLERTLLDSGRAQTRALENGPTVTVTTARSVEKTVTEGLEQNPRFLLR